MSAGAGSGGYCIVYDARLSAIIAVIDVSLSPFQYLPVSNNYRNVERSVACPCPRFVIAARATVLNRSGLDEWLQESADEIAAVGSRQAVLTVLLMLG